MRYDWREMAGLLRTPAGRLQFRSGVLFRLWPALAALARLHRRTLARRVRVIAVVGSLGKSTTSRAVAAALGIPEHPGMLRNAWSSLALALLRLRRAQAHAVVEIGIAGPGEMRGYARLVRPDVTVVTAIASEHHRSLGTLEVTRDEKAWMVRALPADGTAVLNGDDPNVLWMRTQTAARVITCGFTAGCDVQASDIRMAWPRGMDVSVRVFGVHHALTLRLIGRHQVRAALAALAVAHVEGVPIADAVRRLSALEPTPGRLQPESLPNGAVILRDDYKSTVETIHAALDAMVEIPARRRILVLGDVSEPPGRQRGVYRGVADRAAQLASHVIVAGSVQTLERYRPGIRAAGPGAARLLHGGRTPSEIAQALQAMLEPGDVVLLKGRDTQKLDRVRLILQGRDVRCDIRVCHIRVAGCEECPMLGVSWNGRNPVT